MSLLKLDDRREALNQRTEKTQKAVEIEEAPGRDGTIGLFVFIGIAAFAVGWWVAVQNSEFMPLAGALGITVGIFLLSGLVAGIAQAISGKWKTAFVITAILLIASQIISTNYDKQQRANEKPAPRRY